MRLDDEDRIEILAAIADEGATVLWIKKDPVAIDPERPWLGNTTTPTSYSATIAFVDVATAAGYVTQWRRDSDVPSSGLFGLMGAHSFTPEINDRVIRAGMEDLIVKDVTASAPAGHVLFYLIEFAA